MDTSYARFHLKMAADGFLLIDGTMAEGPMVQVVNNALSACKMPTLDLTILRRYEGGQTFTYDMGNKGTHIHIEIAVLSDPGVPPQPVERRHAV
ncbi:hypothetical protein [Sphingobium sp. MK2]|uniref:hypothetical protein n=1 Tax=Sphingobium sp. MK2 TaxID=3116540 RepID=UPI0032E360CD